MKTVYLLRHAKSSWKQKNLHDKERPLNKRGHQDAPFMANWLNNQANNPDLIISSPAVRAYTTALYVADALCYPANKIRIEQSLYFQGTEVILDIIQESNDKYSAILLVGHNPDFWETTERLCQTLLNKYPTCALSKIDFAENKWSELKWETGTLDEFVYPKLLKAYSPQ